jgi:spore coat protein A
MAPSGSIGMSLSRRQLLRIGGGIGLLGATGGFGWLAGQQPTQIGTLLTSQVPLPPPFQQPLRVPPAARVVDGLIEITQRVADAEILPGRRTRVLGYDGIFPGPTLRLRRGQPTRVHVRSELPVPTVVHLHGGKTPPESDGYPTDLILPVGGVHQGHSMGGNTSVGARDYTYPVDQQAATLWYHDHAMDFTGPNVYAGLAGFCLIGDDVDDALPLPRGDRDLPLMICDRAFDGDAQFRYPALSPDRQYPGVEENYAGGVLGDIIMVNGVPWPVHDVAAAKYRLRLLNGSNARRYQLELDPPPLSGPSFTRVGADVGLLTKPVPAEEITLAPAERVEVIVDFAAYPVGTKVTVRNALGSGSTAEVMRFVVARKESDDSAIPAVLAPAEPLVRDDAVNVRDFHFSMRRHDGRGGHPAPEHDWTINGSPYDPAVDLATPRLGDVEIWRFMTNVHHPVHVHLAHLQVLSRNGGQPRSGDVGPKDTVDLLPGEACEVITRFSGYRGRYVLHCHNLEHEDMAMMANFSVV